MPFNKPFRTALGCTLQFFHSSITSLFTYVNLRRKRRERTCKHAHIPVWWQFDDCFASYHTHSQTPPQSQTSCLLFLSFLEVNLPPSLTYLLLTWPFTLFDFLILCQFPPGQIISNHCAIFTLNVRTVFLLQEGYFGYYPIRFLLW